MNKVYNRKKILGLPVCIHQLDGQRRRSCCEEHHKAGVRENSKHDLMREG